MRKKKGTYVRYVVMVVQKIFALFSPGPETDEPRREACVMMMMTWPPALPDRT